MTERAGAETGLSTALFTVSSKTLSKFLALGSLEGAVGLNELFFHHQIALIRADRTEDRNEPRRYAARTVLEGIPL